MSRAATATPPPPYFPPRNATPTMRHCAAPSVSASHFSARNVPLNHSASKRKIKHLPSSLAGLRRKSISKVSDLVAEPDTVDGESPVGPNVIESEDLSAYPAPSFDSMRTDHSSQSDRSARSSTSAPSFYSSSSGNTADSLDSTSLSTPTTASGSFVFQQTHDPVDFDLAFDNSRPEADDDFPALQRFRHASFLTESPSAGTTPTPGTPSGKSWVPHFGFGQLAKARAAVSTGFASFGEKRRREVSGSMPGASLASEVAPPADEMLSSSNDLSNLIGSDPYPADTSDLLNGPHFRPMSEMPVPPTELLQGLNLEEQERKKEEWTDSQRKRLTQCAQLCSQWPLSGYHMSKFGPNGAKHYYEPQSFSNPQHVARLMQRQHDLEASLCHHSALHFPSTRPSRSFSASEGSDDRDRDSAPPSPTISDDLHTARELQRAMASDLMTISANSSQVSLLPPFPAGAQIVHPVHVKRKIKRDNNGDKIKIGSSIPELSGFASKLALSRSVGQKSLAREDDMEMQIDDLGMRDAMMAEVDVEFDDGDTDTTSLAPSVSSLRDTIDSGRALLTSSLVLPLPSAQRPSTFPLTRPARAQSCGSKRPSCGPASDDGRGRDVGEEEKRRRVDEAMVLDEAVSTGVILPSDRADRLGAANKAAGGLSLNGDRDDAEGCGALARMCASTPDLGSARSQSVLGSMRGPKSYLSPLGTQGLRTGSHTVIPPRVQTQAPTPTAAQESDNAGAMFGHIVKTSDTHPIIISPFFPSELLPLISNHLVLPSRSSPFIATSQQKPLRLFSSMDVAATLLSHTSPHLSPLPAMLQSSPEHANGKPLLGNLLLSSCPGKRLRMDGPVKGRGPVCRDLKTDLERIKSEGVGCLVCCLDDAELALLGVPWGTYREVAADIGLDVIRLPMPDGFTPVSIPLFDAQVSLIATRYTLRGINVLVHCRGGVGRAGLTACAWAIKMGFVQCHPSLAVVEQRALAQVKEGLQQQQRQQQQQNPGASSQAQAQAPAPSPSTCAPSNKLYKGFSIFPHSRSTERSQSSSTPTSAPLSRSGSLSTGSSSSIPPTSGLSQSQPSVGSNIATKHAIPAELEHQIVMSTVERVIAMIRSRRGLKAIESFEQVQFLVEYVRWLRAAGV